MRTRFLLLALFFSAALCAGEKPDPLRLKAEAGDTAAQFQLANEYFSGTKERKKNYTLAAHWFLSVADKGVSEGLFNYALCLEQGLGVERDPFRAAEYYEKAAKDGSLPYAVFNHALILRNGVRCRDESDRKKMPEGWKFHPDPEKADALLRKLANKHFAPAQAELAEILLSKPSPTPEEKQEIFSLLSEAVRSPEAPAKAFRLLSDCCFAGIGTVPDSKKMISLLHTAVTRGDPKAALMLAYCYDNGMNVKPDAAKALELYRKAAFSGYPEALLKYGEAIEQGRVPGASVKDAMEYYRLASEANLPAAWFRLAEILSIGASGVEANPRTAAHFYFQSARGGHPRAQYETGMLFLKKDSPIGYDPRAAVYWFKQGAARNDGPSMRALAQCYFDGTGCERNRDTGMMWLKRAADAGDLRALDMIRRR